MTPFLTRDSGDIDALRRICTAETTADQVPHAVEIEQKIPLYDGASVASLAADPDTRHALMAEWLWVLSDGPGIVAIRGALPDYGVIDRATSVFEGIIDAEKNSASGGGDHFAKPGSNDRVWNALQKHCLADPAGFADYFASPTIDLISRAWLGDGYQITAQVNRVNPGGAAQTPHRDYHLGFMSPERMEAFPPHVHRLSPMLTLQGAVAHCDMPLPSGPTVYLPYSQQLLEGYIAFGRPEFQAYFQDHSAQLPLQKGDAVFFNPAVMHGAGHNVSSDIYRLANLLQVSSAFGIAMEAMDRSAMIKALYPILLGQPREAQTRIIAAAAAGYAFPTSLDTDPPSGGLAPRSQAEITQAALATDLSVSEFSAEIDAHDIRRQPS